MEIKKGINQKIIKNCVNVIGFLTLVFYYLLITTFFAILIDKIFPPFNHKQNKVIITFEVVLQIALLGVILHNTKKIALHLPFIFDGTCDYDHNIEQDNNLELLVAISVFMFQTDLMNKVKFLANSTKIVDIQYS